MRRARRRRVALPRGPDPDQAGAEYASQACPSCGAAVHTGATFCHVCGAPQAAVPAASGAAVGRAARRHQPGPASERPGAKGPGSQYQAAAVILWIACALGVLAGGYVFYDGWTYGEQIRATVLSGEPVDSSGVVAAQNLARMLTIEGAVAVLFGVICGVLAVRAQRRPAPNTLVGGVFSLVVILVSLLGRLAQEVPLEPIPLSIAALVALVLWSSYFGARSHEARQRMLQARERREGGGGPARPPRRRIV